MNYAYNYQLNGRQDNIGYSDGRLASVVLNEKHLSEILPLPMEKVAFLAGRPISTNFSRRKTAKER